MENSIYIGLSRQMTLSRELEIVANNIANMNTPGFRAQNSLFEEYVAKTGGHNDSISLVNDSGQYDVTKPGPVRSTESPLDVAINGPGFLGVNTPDGQLLYTRAGDFTMNANGELITHAGYNVAGEGAGNITIPQGSTGIKIDEQGVISNQDGPIGKLMVVEFDNLQSLTPMGNNTYKTDEASKPAQETVVKQGFLEGSNVVPVLEMTKMIELSRTFQQLQNSLEGEHSRIRNAIRKLTSTQ